MQHFTLTIGTIHCINCVNAIKNGLVLAFPELEIIRLNDIDKELEIKFDDTSSITIEKIIEEIEDLGHEVGKYNKELTEQQFLYRFFASAALGLPLLLLSALGISLPVYAMWAVASLSMGVMFYAGDDIFKKGFKSFIHTGRPNTDTLFSLSTLAAFAISFSALFFPALPFEFASALLIFSSRHIGKYIESKMKQQVHSNIDFNNNFPDSVKKMSICPVTGSKTYQTILTKDIKVGDVLYFNENTYIPVDGELQSESAKIMQTIVNGSLEKETIHKEAKILAGTQVASSQLTLKVEQTLENSYYSVFEKRLKESQQQKSNTKVEAFTETLIKYFIPIVITTAAVTFSIALPVYGLMVAIHSAMAILVGACPCTLGFITPLAMRVGVNKSASHGATIYNKGSIETASKLKKLVLDLNGTITQGKSEVNGLSVYSKTLSREKILKIVLSLESKTTNEHHIGTALKYYAQKNLATQDTLNVTEFIENEFSGIQGCIDKANYHLGNECLLNALEIKYSEAKPNRQYLVKENEIVAHFDITNPIHKDAPATIKQFQAQNIEVIVCSGASEETVKFYTKPLNIKKYKANCRGEKKADFIREQKEDGCVAMVGDAVNDSIALVEANIGIAVASADKYSKNAADVVLNKKGLKPVENFVKNSKDTMSILKQNLLLSLLYNLVVMSLTMLFTLSLGAMAPAIMALSMGVQSLIILANTYRLSTLSMATTKDPLELADDILAETDIYEETNELITSKKNSLTPKNKETYTHSFWSCIKTLPNIFVSEENKGPCCKAPK